MKPWGKHATPGVPQGYPRGKFASGGKFAPALKLRLLLPGNAEEIWSINDSAARLNDRLLTLLSTCSTIALDLDVLSNERKAVLPDMAGDHGLVACLASDLTQFATDLLLLYHATHSVCKTLGAMTLLPVTITISSRILHYSNLIRYSVDRTHMPHAINRALE